MKALFVLSIATAVAGVIALLASFPVESQYSQRARLIQRVQIDPGAELFGDVGTPIGSPQKMIIDDPKAFLGEKSESGAELVSEAYLKENGIYPLQLQTVQFVANNVRIGSAVAMLLGAVGGLLARRRLKK